MHADPQNDSPSILTIALKGDIPSGTPGNLVELDLSKFHSGRWALQLDEAISRRREPVVLLARGVACLAVSWWAKLSPSNYLKNIRGAIFLSPLTIGFGQAAAAAAARLSPAIRLPFPSIVASDSTPVMEQVLELADGWGSRFVDTGFTASERRDAYRGRGTAAEEQLLDLLGRLFDGNPVAAGMRSVEITGPRLTTIR